MHFCYRGVLESLLLCTFLYQECNFYVSPFSLMIWKIRKLKKKVSLHYQQKREISFKFQEIFFESERCNNVLTVFVYFLYDFFRVFYILKILLNILVITTICFICHLHFKAEVILHFLFGNLTILSILVHWNFLYTYSIEFAFNYL